MRANISDDLASDIEDSKVILEKARPDLRPLLEIYLVQAEDGLTKTYEVWWATSAGTFVTVTTGGLIVECEQFIPSSQEG